MQCVVIAAGRGSRLASLGEPKPLNKLCGIPLIVRIISAVRDAGIDDFVIVVGYLGDHVKECLGDGRSWGVNIEYVDNPEWQKANGISVLKAKQKINGPFLLTMADHIFDKETIIKMRQFPLASDEVMLAVDYQVADNDLIDLDDVTKVQVCDGQVRAISKTLEKYNAFDSGLFMCSPVLFDAIEESIVSTGDDSLSGGIRSLAHKGKMLAFDIEGRFWIDVDDEKAFQKAEHYLKNGSNLSPAFARTMESLTAVAPNPVCSSRSGG